MIEKILSRIAYWIHVCEIEVNKASADLDEDEIEYYKGQLMAYEHTKAIVQEVAKEYDWIPYTINGELPNNGQRVWLSFTTPYTSYVKSAWWIYDHFEWANGKTVKDYPFAWKPYEVPAPYQKGE